MLEFAAALPMLAEGAQIAGAGLSIFNLLKGNKPSAAEIQMQQRQQQIDQLNQALQDPNNPYHKYLVEQESQGMRNDMQTYLRDLMNANNRAALLGRQTVFDPERRDEALSQYVTQGAQKIAPQANLNANNRILQAINSANGSMSGLNTLATLQTNRANQNRSNQAEALKGIGGLLGSFNNSNNGAQNINVPATYGDTNGWLRNGWAPVDTSQGNPWLYQ